jgi:hypothetical protein
MQETPENINWAYEKLDSLKYLPGFPKEARSLESIARAFLRIVHDKTYEEILKGIGVDYDEMVKRNAEADEDRGEHTPIMPRSVNDVDWLLARVADTCDRFPMPVKMRAMHDSVFAPACKELENFPARMEGV